MSMNLSGFVHKKTPLTIGTEEFIFTELTLGDMAEFKAHLINDRKKLNVERRGRLMKDAESIEGIDPLELLKLTDTSISEEEVEAETETVEGIGYLAYLSLRYAHPEISVENVMEIITPNILDDVTPALFPSDEPEIDKKKPKQTKPKRKRSRI